MKKLEAEIPDRLHEAMAGLVQEGWYRDEAELVREAIRRFLETHRPDLMAQFVREDIEWGLRGQG